jgi:hypothetical protein
VKFLQGLNRNGRLLALPANIRLQWKCTEVANPLAYYDTATITVVKSFKVKAFGVNLIKLFFVTVKDAK